MDVFEALQMFVGLGSVELRVGRRMHQGGEFPRLGNDPGLRQL